MRRREFLNTGAGALLAMAASKNLSAQFPVATPVTQPPRGPIKLEAYSRFLQWIRNPDQVAEAIIDLGYDGLDITVRPYPGHVDPARVRTDLPPFVKAIRAHGLRVDTITPPISSADSPHAEAILSTAHDLGIRYYWWGGAYRYSMDQPVQAQLDALKPRVAKLAALNAKYEMTMMYHTYSGASAVGAGIWDLLYLLRDHDPKQVGLHYDIGHMVVAGGGGTWVASLRAAAPYVVGVSCKDYVIESTLQSPEGGPMTPAEAKILAAQRGFFGGPPGRGRRGPGGRGRGGRGPAGPPAPGVGGRAGGRRGGPGRGPGRGAFFLGNKPGWVARAVPLGTGMVDLAEFGAQLKQMNFNGPMEIQVEYPLGGADTGADHITLPRDIVMGAIKRDRLALEAVFAPYQLLYGPLSTL